MPPRVLVRFAVVDFYLGFGLVGLGMSEEKPHEWFLVIDANTKCILDAAFDKDDAIAKGLAMNFHYAMEPVKPLIRIVKVQSVPFEV